MSRIIPGKTGCVKGVEVRNGDTLSLSQLRGDDNPLYVYLYCKYSDSDYFWTPFFKVTLVNDLDYPVLVPTMRQMFEHIETYEDDEIDTSYTFVTTDDFLVLQPLGSVELSRNIIPHEFEKDWVVMTYEGYGVPGDVYINNVTGMWVFF